MTNGSSAAMAFLSAHPGRPTGSRSRSSTGSTTSSSEGDDGRGSSKNAAATGPLSPGEALLLPSGPAAATTTGGSDSGSGIPSDLVPSANTFIRKLYQMVTTEDQEIIAFTSGTDVHCGLGCVRARPALCCRYRTPTHPPTTTTDGLSFHVKDPTRLEQEVLPRYFRHSRFQSLVRQLNFYDFKARLVCVWGGVVCVCQWGAARQEKALLPAPFLPNALL